ncbi:hypothetical protein TNCV_4036011 [Trichonephila clavipes]|nr:hypothetical protein TNCV_4036011 [Trichonephila clavipes]
MNLDHYKVIYIVTRTSSTEQNVVDTVRRNPSTSVRAIAVAKGRSRNSINRVLRRESEPLHSCRLRRVPSQIAM